MALQVHWMLSWIAVAVLVVQAYGQFSPPEGLAVLVGNWGQCRRINSSSTCYRQRSASCIRARNNATAPWYYCEDSGMQRAPETETCPEERCARDCVVSLWSQWSECDCAISRYRSRYRDVVLPPKNGGAPCPALTENVTCGSCASTLDTLPRTYTWRVRQWGNCEAANQSSRCGYGLRNRAVECVDLEGKTVNGTHCLTETAYARVVPPASRQLCEIRCPCVLSEWTPWSDDPTSSGVQRRSRTLLQVPTMGETCPATEESRACQLSPSADVCPEYTWETSEWSTCTFTSGSTCGTGLRRRYIYCLQDSMNGSSVSVDLEKCDLNNTEPRPLELESCEVTCPRDCVVSPWTDWSPCPATCDPTYSNRTRDILISSLGSGMQCSHLIELKLCPSVPCVQWGTGDYTECFPSGGTCGEGEQTRRIFCTDASGVEIDFDHCSDLPLPERTANCYKPCSNDCVLSDWSHWTKCSANCIGITGTQTRTRRFTAYGTSCPFSTANLTETRGCTTNTPCTEMVYHIQVSSWGVCYQPVANNGGLGDSNRSNLTTPLPPVVCTGEGVQNRTAGCMKDNTEIMSSECPIEFQSLETRSCNMSCASDCLFSEWMNFSPCSATCGEGYRTRSRLLIQFPDTTANLDCRVNENGVQTEVEQCVLPPCTSNVIYSWNAEPWSHCYVLPSMLSKLSHNFQNSGTTHPPCGHGYRNRTVYCEDSSNTAVAEQFCIDSSTQQNSKPSSHQACVVPCADRCIISDWSEFSTCHNGTVNRTREVIAFSGSSNWRDNCPELVAIATLETAPCSTVNYNQYSWTFTSLWGECILNFSNNATCGNGFQYRSYSCIDHQNRLPVSEELCMGQVSQDTERGCNIPCQKDCETSEWSVWTDCSVTCGLGYRTRTRTIQKQMQEGGRECGPLSETTVCVHTPCEFPEYRVGSYGPCVLVNTSGICGEGIETREPLCVVNGVTQSDHSSCAGLEVISGTERSCSLPCPGECVVSAWGPWSECPEVCPNSICQRNRRRRILRQGTNCPRTTAFRNCPQVSNPFEWSIQPWTDCIISSPGNADYCGNGLQHRIVQCVNVVLNRTVFESNCENSGFKPTAIQACSLPCPVDCKVGPFSPWTECPSICQIRSNETRQRNILIHPSNGGQACPPLTERKPCLSRNCVNYMVEAHVSRCSAEYTNTSSCGSVESAKTVSCRKNNRFVNLGECVNVSGSENLQGSDEYCDLPCLTEPNCTYTDWSEWSECTHLCHQSSSQTFTFRSRRLLKSLERYGNECLRHQFEELPCRMENTSDVGNASAPCIEFNWQTAEWDQDRSRTVWCQSGTGSRVSESGCIDAIRPVARQGTCRSKCDDLTACNSTTGDCECSPLYEKVGSVCLPTRGCFVNSHCLYPNSFCDLTTLSCACAEGWELMGGACVSRQPTSLPTDTTPPTTDQVTSPMDPVTSPTDQETSLPPATDQSTPEPGGLGVLPIALISALPLVVVIAALLILIVITYRCRQRLEKRHVEERKQKLRSITISHPAPLPLTTEAVQGMRRGADSASSGFVDDREIENDVFKYGISGRTLGGLPEIDIDEAAFPRENDYATIPRQLPIGYPIPPVPHPPSPHTMPHYVQDEEHAMQERVAYLDEYPGVPITDGSSLAPSSVHSPFALRRHNPLQDQGEMMMDGDTLTYSSTASTPYIPQQYQHRPSSLPHDPPTHQPSSSRHHRPYSPSYNSPTHQPSSPRSFFPDYDIPPPQPPSPRQHRSYTPNHHPPPPRQHRSYTPNHHPPSPRQHRSYTPNHHPPSSQPTTPHYPHPSHHPTRHYSERSQSPTPLGYPGPSHSYPSSRLGYHHTRDERLTAGMEGPLVRAIAQMAGSTDKASPTATSVGSRNSSHRSSGRRVRYRHPYPGNQGPYPGNWGQYHGVYPSNHGRYPGDISLHPSNFSSPTHSPYLNARNSHLHEGGTSTLPRHSSHGYSHQYYHDHHHQEVVDYNEAPPTPYSHYDVPRREGSPHLHHSTSAPYSDMFAQQDAGNEAATTPQQPGSPYLSGRSPAHPSPLVLNSFSSEERRVAQSHSSYPHSSNIESPSSSPYHRTAQHQPDVYSDAYVEQHQHVPVLPPSGSSHRSEHYRLGRQPSIPRREPPVAHYARPRADQRSSEGSESEQTPNTSATSTDDSMQDADNHVSDPPMEMPCALEGDSPTITFGLQGTKSKNEQPREGFLSQPTVTTFK